MDYVLSLRYGGEAQWKPFDSPGSRLVNEGRAKKENQKRFYRFSLIDPIDQPFATFKYYYRTQSKYAGQLGQF